MHRTAPILSLLLALPACNKPAEPAAPPAATAPPAAAPAAPAAPIAPAPPGAPMNPAQAMAQAQSALAAMGQAQPGAVKAVNWRDLLPLLPDEAAGWKADQPGRGSSNTMGAMQITEVQRQYKMGTAVTNVKIVDTSFYQPMLAGWQIARTVTQDSSEGYQRPVDVGGQPGLEKWHNGKSGQVNVLVAGRFLVTIESGNIPDTKGLLALAGKIDVAKLTALGK